MNQQASFRLIVLFLFVQKRQRLAVDNNLKYCHNWASLKPLCHHSTIVLRGLRGAIIRPPLCRKLPVSCTAWSQNCFQVTDIKKIHRFFFHTFYEKKYIKNIPIIPICLYRLHFQCKRYLLHSWNFYLELNNKASKWYLPVYNITYINYCTNLKLTKKRHT